MLKQFVGKAVGVVVVGIYCLDKKEQWCQTHRPLLSSHLQKAFGVSRKKKHISSTGSFPVEGLFAQPHSQSRTLKMIRKKADIEVKNH